MEKSIKIWITISENKELWWNKYKTMSNLTNIYEKANKDHEITLHTRLANNF